MAEGTVVLFLAFVVDLNMTLNSFACLDQYVYILQLASER